MFLLILRTSIVKIFLRPLSVRFRLPSPLGEARGSPGPPLAGELILQAGGGAECCAELRAAVCVCGGTSRGEPKLGADGRGEPKLGADGASVVLCCDGSVSLA